MKAALIAILLSPLFTAIPGVAAESSIPFNLSALETDLQNLARISYREKAAFLNDVASVVASIPKPTENQGLVARFMIVKKLGVFIDSVGSQAYVERVQLRYRRAVEAYGRRFAIEDRALSCARADELVWLHHLMASALNALGQVLPLKEHQDFLADQVSKIGFSLARRTQLNLDRPGLNTLLESLSSSPRERPLALLALELARDIGACE